MTKIENVHITEISPLVAPRELKTQLALPPDVQEHIAEGRKNIEDLLLGKNSRRLLAVVGPCSIHDADAALEYATRLRRVANDTQDQLLIVMRTYFEKPRTVVGWKGLVSDPHLDGSSDLESGLKLARSIMLRINALGLLCGTEFLDPIVPQYVADLVSWAAIGARTTESQTHRQMASGLSMPIGFKNSTDGSLQNALNALISARHPHAFLGINADGMTSVVKTTGNPYGHVVLRGGSRHTNYHTEDIARAVELVSHEGLTRGVVVDCSHDNSRKDHTKQATVFQEVVDSFVQHQRGLLGVMIESNLQPGQQSWKPGTKLEYGISITDACMGWKETEQLLYGAAERISSGPAPKC